SGADARRLGARSRGSLRAGRRRTGRHGLRPDLRRLPGDFAPAARRPRLLRQGRGAGFRTRAQLHARRQLSAQDHRRAALGRAGWRRGRLPRHGGGAAAADRPGAGAPGQGCETRPRQRLRHDQLRPWSRFRRGDPPMLDKPKRKNPVLRTRLPTLPPAARSRAALGLTAAAALGRFELQQCRDCGTVQYPPREACQQCLSIRLDWKPQPPDGELLAATVLHHSNDLFFRERLPWRLGLVKLDCGPTVVAHLHERVASAPSRVIIAAKLDRAGQAVLVALPDKEANMAEDRQLREFTCDPKFRKVLVTDGKTAAGQAIVNALAQAGAELIWVGYAEPWKKFSGFDALSKVSQVTLLTLDVTDSKNVRELAAEI